jgi:hypothetical protein
MLSCSGGYHTSKRKKKKKSMTDENVEAEAKLKLEHLLRCRAVAVGR